MSKLEMQKAIKDADFMGVGILVDGKHVDIGRVKIIRPAGDARTVEELSEKVKLLEELVKLYEFDLKDVHLLVSRDLVTYKSMVQTTLAFAAKVKKKMSALAKAQAYLGKEGV